MPKNPARIQKAKKQNAIRGPVVSGSDQLFSSFNPYFQLLAPKAIEIKGDHQLSAPPIWFIHALTLLLSSLMF